MIAKAVAQQLHLQSGNYKKSSAKRRREFSISPLRRRSASAESVESNLNIEPQGRVHSANNLVPLPSQPISTKEHSVPMDHFESRGRPLDPPFSQPTFEQEQSATADRFKFHRRQMEHGTGDPMDARGNTATDATNQPPHQQLPVLQTPWPDSSTFHQPQYFPYLVQDYQQHPRPQMPMQGSFNWNQHQQQPVIAYPSYNYMPPNSRIPMFIPPLPGRDRDRGNDQSLVLYQQQQDNMRQDNYNYQSDARSPSSSNSLRASGIHIEEYLDSPNKPP